jgi:hypothetical protein
VSVLWYVRNIVVSVVISKITLITICLTYHNTDNNMSDVSQPWQQYVIRIIALTTICHAYHITDNNISYLSQHWQQYVLHITTQEILLSVLRYARHIVVSFVIRKIYCCQSYYAQDILLSVMWYVRSCHNATNNMSFVSQHW